MQIQQKKSGLISYYQKGENPTLLIHTGTHGDEYSVIKFTKEYIFKHAHELPDFIYVPEVSPSAVNKKTRKNINEVDLNRDFFDSSIEEEIIDNLEIINQFKFDLCIDIHEDYEYPEFYLYDSEIISDTEWKKFTIKMNNFAGLNTLNGIDDPFDPVFGKKFINGYFSHKLFDLNDISGDFADYLLINKVSKRVIVPEIPTIASDIVKEKAISLIFSDLLPTLV